MFCPICKAEYRLGFTECTDCGVPLVEHLENAQPAEEDQVDPEYSQLLWQGTYSQAFGLVAAALDDAKIAYGKFKRDAEPLPGVSAPVYTILVHPCDREAAEAVLQDLQRQFEVAKQASNAGESATDSIPLSNVEMADTSDTQGPTNDFVPDDFDPRDATVEVWSGADAEMAGSLQAALRENGIGCAISLGSVTNRVSVLPDDEARAREIIREVVEATPPQ